MFILNKNIVNEMLILEETGANFFNKNKLSKTTSTKNYRTCTDIICSK
jgi:hypothetical protein